MSVDSLRVLFATGSPAGYMLPPLLGSEQVNCGPDWLDARAPDGRIRSLMTPAGDYDLGAIAARLPQEQQPDVVVCLVDASWRNRPRNLGAFKCPRILLVADTHHLQTPLLGMLRYATSEPFTRVVLLYDRHHAGVFRAAGVRDVHWFPGLTFPHEDAVVRAARRATRAPNVAFVGQAGRFHPRRKRLLDTLVARRVAVTAKAVPQSQALGFYGGSLVGFNASLNGDLNLRVFEILASGAALLTDRLAPSAGLESLFSEREILRYASADELAERAIDALARPAETAAIGAAGARWFDEHFNATRRRAAFRALAFDGVSPAEFSWSADDARVRFFPDAGDLLTRALVVYEAIQELHRTQETVHVSLDATAPEDFAQLCATLPRVHVTRDVAASPTADWRVCDSSQAQSDVPSAPRVWCWNAGQPDQVPLLERFLPAGYAPLRAGLAAFQRVELDAALPQGSQGALAFSLLQRGDPSAALVLAKSALASESGAADACVVLGTLALRTNNRALSAKMIERGLQFDPRDARLLALGAQLNLPTAALNS